MTFAPVRAASPMLLAAIAGLAIPRPATAAPAIAVTASSVEPGTLPRGAADVRLGVGLGQGPLLLGGEVALGLGGVDVLASAGGAAMCLFETCDGIGALGGGLAVHLAGGPRLRVGLRATAQVVVDDGAEPAVFVAAVIDAGTARWRLAFEPTAARWPDDETPAARMTELDRWYLGGMVVGRYASPRGSLTLGGGVAWPLDAAGDVLPLVTATWSPR